MSVCIKISESDLRLNWMLGVFAISVTVFREVPEISWHESLCPGSLSAAYIPLQLAGLGAWVIRQLRSWTSSVSPSAWSWGRQLWTLFERYQTTCACGPSCRESSLQKKVETGYSLITQKKLSSCSLLLNNHRNHPLRLASRNCETTSGTGCLRSAKCGVTPLRLS